MEWVKKQKELKGILIWVYHKELGKWAVERLKTDGYDVLHCPSGTEYDRIITDPESANRIVVASMSAHGLGKNLQHFQHPYYLQWPRPADMAEQTLGRVHRQGQMADEIIATTCLTTAWDELNFAATLNDALYIHQSIGARQKCIFANYDPLPVVKPSGFLRERGFQNTMLNKDDQKVLTQKFKS